MRDLVKAGLSFSWTMPLFGAQQLVYWLAPTAERRRQSAAGLDAVSRAAAGGLDQSSLGRLYQLGQCLQEGLVQLAPTLLTPELLYPSTWLELSLEVAQRSLTAARQVAEGEALLALDEIRAKGEVFCLVLDVAKLIGVPTEPPFPLYELLARAYALGPFRALWAVEGLGKEYGDSFWNQGIVPHAILRDERTSGLPAQSLTMLNAGIGLSFAFYCLDKTSWRTNEPALRGLVQEILRLCRDNAREGYLGAAYESLGLVTRTFHADLVPAVDAALRQSAPEVLGYYWHGVGRAIYFAIINFLPGSDGLIFRMARDEAPDGAAKLSSVAGAAWAYALVAQRDPRILAELVIEPYGEELAADDAFANGVASSMMMRFDTTPEAPFIPTFYQYQPSPSNPRLVRLWEQLVRRPSELALNVYYPVIKQHNRLGDIFEYRDLAAFVARLQREAA